MLIADQKKLLNNCKIILNQLQGKAVEKEFECFYSFLIQGEKDNCTITLPKAERVANEGFIYVYGRFDKTKKGTNTKFNVFIEDVTDFRFYIDEVIDECYSEKELKEQLVFDAIGKRDANLYNEIYK